MSAAIGVLIGAIGIVVAVLVRIDLAIEDIAREMKRRNDAGR